jgi:zinc/manganese transport system ATP-binding protein
MNNNLIRLADVTVTYDRHPAVHHLSGCFEAGSMTAIAGPNGAGKSTLVKALMGQLPLAGGTIDRSGLSPRDVGYLPQAAEIDRSFPLSVADTVMLGAWRDVGAFRGMSDAVAAKAAQALSTVGLDGFEHRHIGSLSAGQFQRVLFARLLLQDAPLILLDEPLTRDLLEILRNWHREGRTVIAVLHDFEQVKACFPQTLLIAREPVCWGPTASVMAPDNLAKARAMAEAWDQTAEVCERPKEVAA